MVCGSRQTGPRIAACVQSPRAPRRPRQARDLEGHLRPGLSRHLWSFHSNAGSKGGQPHEPPRPRHPVPHQLGLTSPKTPRTSVDRHCDRLPLTGSARLQTQEHAEVSRAEMAGRGQLQATPKSGLLRATLGGAGVSQQVPPQPAPYARGQADLLGAKCRAALVQLAVRARAGW